MKKPRFLKRVVTLCLIVMTIVTAFVLVMSWRCYEQISSETLGILFGAWCSELLMSLLKRNKEEREKESSQQIYISPEELEDETL